MLLVEIENSRHIGLKNVIKPLFSRVGRLVAAFPNTQHAGQLAVFDLGDAIAIDHRIFGFCKTLGRFGQIVNQPRQRNNSFGGFVGLAADISPHNILIIAAPAEVIPRKCRIGQCSSLAQFLKNNARHTPGKIIVVEIDSRTEC